MVEKNRSNSDIEKHNFDLKIMEIIELLKDPEDLNTFFHNTNSLNNAEKILRNGFRFTNYLENSSDQINLFDPISTKYFFSTRKVYGNYTVVIQISSKLINFCHYISKDNELNFYEVISEQINETDEEDSVYLLPPFLIRGYIDLQKNRLIENPAFSILFSEEEIKRLYASKFTPNN